MTTAQKVRSIFPTWLGGVCSRLGMTLAFFNSVQLGAHGAIEWGTMIDICPDAMYHQLTGKSPEDVFPNLRPVSADA